MSGVLESSRWPEYGKMHPELEKIFEAQPELKTKSIADAPDVPTAQAYLLTMVAQMMASGLIPPPDLTGIDKTEVQIPMRDGASIRALVYSPQQAPAGGSPLAVLYHGGGWCIGMPEMEEMNGITIARKFGGVTVSVDYRKAPDHVFPTAVNDSFDALKWCAANAPKLGADPSKGFLVGGTSAGANLAAVVSHLARDEKLSPPLTGVMLHVPAVLSPEAVPDHLKAEYTAYEQNKNAPILDSAAMEFFRKYYKPDPKSELFNPFIWPSGHKDLPPTYFQISGMDPLRDDGLLYERELRNVGIKTRVDVYPGLPHGFEAFFPTVSLAAKALTDKEAGFAWLLGKQ